MSKKASGTSPREREDFLKRHGYTKIRSCNGSHDVWHHLLLKKLYEDSPKNPLEMPANIRSCEQQSPWAVTLPDNPAHATWIRLQKQVQWAKEAFEQAQSKTDTLHIDNFKTRALQRSLIKAWKKAVKHSLKLGQVPPTRPPENLKPFTR